MATQRFLLKVLSGLYKDSELPLQQGEYLFGSAVENDISIEDPSLASSAGKIMVSESGIVVELNDAGGAVHVGGYPHSEPKVELKPYEPMYLGDFCFVIGYEGEQWPAVDLARHAARPEQSSEASGEEGGDDETESTDDESLAEHAAKGTSSYDQQGDESAFDDDEDGADASSLLDASETAEGDESGKADKSRFKRKLAFVALTVLVFAAVSFIGLNVWKAQQEMELQLEEARVSNEERIRQVLLDADRSIEFREPATANGRPRIVGYVPNEKELASLVKKLDEADTQYQLEVYVTEQMVQATYSMLNAFAFEGLEISPARDAGSLLARGYIEDVDRWGKIKGVIERDIDGLTTFIDQVETPASRFKKLEESILRAGLDEQVRLYLSPEGTVFARTALSFENEEKWQILEDVFKKSFGNQPRLVTLVNDNNWLKIVAINFTGPVPYMVLADGRKYIEGSNLDNGYKLKEINDNGVVLLGQFGERVMPIRLGE